MHDTLKIAPVYPAQEKPDTLILPEGFLLQNFRIIKMLGRSNISIAYLAYDEITKTEVVLKAIFPTEISFQNMNSLLEGSADELQTHDWILSHILEDAEIIARLKHPNIIPIHLSFRALGAVYCVMPYVKGTELHMAAPVPDSITAEWLLPILEKILNALDYLHSHGIIHLNIKPGNILMNAAGEPILINFGTKYPLQKNSNSIDLPGFMPLEHLSTNKKYGPWTDFYALGATSYSLITGETPPPAAERLLEDNYRPLADIPALAERFPKHILSSIDKALLMNTEERWQSAQEWLEALKNKPEPANPALHNADSQTPLAIASDNSHTECSADNVKPQQDEEKTPAQNSTQPAPKFSLRKNKPLIISILLLTALNSIGIYSSLPPNVKLLLRGISSEEYSAELIKAVNASDIDKIQRLLAAGADVNSTDNNGSTPLIEAVSQNNTELLRLLLAVPGIDVNKTNQNGSTPLIEAVSQNNTELLRLLLAVPGIDVNKTNQNGSTPLIEAVSQNNTELLRLLLAVPGIDVNKTNQTGYTPLCYATFSGHSECVRLLLTAPGIDANKAEKNGWSPLYWAIHYCNTECVRLLLTAPGIDVNQTDKLGETPLGQAASIDSPEIVRLLLEAPGIDVNQTNRFNQTPLCQAASLGHTESVRLLLEVPGIDVNQTDRLGLSPLRAAESYNHTECANLIRAAGGRR